MEVIVGSELFATKNEMLLKHLHEDLALEELLVFFVEVIHHFIGFAFMVLEASAFVGLR